MIKTFATALVCVASVVSMAHAQTSGSAGAGAPVGAGRTGITGSSSVVTPPASTGVGRVGRPERLDLAARTALDRYQPGPAARHRRQQRRQRQRRHALTA